MEDGKEMNFYEGQEERPREEETGKPRLKRSKKNVEPEGRRRSVDFGKKYAII
jgi:hypothetical protein